MLVTLAGMLTEGREVQPEKAELPMLVTLSGIVTEVSEVQFRKAELPMLVPPVTMTSFSEAGT